MPKVMRCNKCGLCYPEDYMAEWGRKYGRGLGADPVCEGLSSNYHRPAKIKGANVKSVEQIMHPLEVCRGTVSLVDVTAQELKENTPILAVNDKGMAKRAEIMRGIQMTKSGSMRSAVESFTGEAA